MLSKQQLRRQLLQQRQGMSLTDWQQKSDRICHHLRNSDTFEQAHTIFAYLSFRQEPTLQSLFDDHHQWGLPRCSGSELVWHHWHPTDLQHLERGQYGITEPRAALPTLSPAQADLVLVPAIACDAQGYRLGYGGGYYDRLLSRWRSLQTIGIIFSDADLIELPTDPWDQSLTAVCTDLGFRPLDGKT
ncbi:MAG: 5-formyltetrahydrofolate cyclo-ligase [Thermosynechococcaceae cyanobacterium]